METARISFRPATADDVPLLRQALLLNANAVVADSVAGEEIDALWRFQRYFHGFPGVHDFGVVAESDGTPLGVAWATFSAESDPSPGYVDDDIPEITISVFEGLRGFGIGYELLVEIEKEALRRGFRALSLWVEEGNRSRRLYERRGFAAVHGVFDAGTMLKRL